MANMNAIKTLLVAEINAAIDAHNVAAKTRR